LKVSGRLHRYLLDIEGRPDTFKGLSGRLHRNQVFCGHLFRSL